MKTHDKKEIRKLVNGELGEEAKSQLFSSAVNGEVDKATSKQIHLELNKKINRALPWRERIPKKKLAKIIDEAQAAPPAPPFVPTHRPLSEIVADINCIAKSKARDKASAERFIDGHTELLLRDEGLLDILYGQDDSDTARKRIDRLTRCVEKFVILAKPTLTEYVRKRVPALPTEEIESALASLTRNVKSYFGAANDWKELTDWVLDFAVRESKRRVLVNKIIEDYRHKTGLANVIFSALIDELLPCKNLVRLDESEDLFMEVIELLWIDKELGDSIAANDGTASLSTRLYKLAARYARNHTKTAKGRVAIERRNPDLFPIPEPESTDPDYRD